jgi:hypothetical protein
MFAHAFLTVIRAAAGKRGSRDVSVGA